MLSLCLLLLGSFSNAKAEQIRGLSAFAITHPGFPCSAFLTAYDNVKIPGVAVLFKTFGEDYACLKRFTEKFANKPHLIEIHLTNGPCRRNRQCEEGELLLGVNERELNKRLEQGDAIVLGAYHWRWNEMVRAIEQFENKNTVVVVSLELEDNFTRAAKDRLYVHLENLRDEGLIRGFPIVSNPHRVKYHGNAPFVETHALKGKCGANCFANNDGNYNTDFRAFMKAQRNALGVFLWDERLQGRAKGSKFIAPRKRHFVLRAADAARYQRLLTQ